jgi:hypothetical protein
MRENCAEIDGAKAAQWLKKRWRKLPDGLQSAARFAKCAFWQRLHVIQ